jgi:UDP-N-acetylglucosamine enolpyruvyl transferase
VRFRCPSDRPAHQGFKALGAQVEVNHGVINATAQKLTGCHIHFDKVSVGRNVNVMTAAVHARGLTILGNAAKSRISSIWPTFSTHGADIRGAGTDVIKIHGVGRVRPTTYSIIPDQIEAGTYMAIAPPPRGHPCPERDPEHLESIMDKLAAVGAETEESTTPCASGPAAAAERQSDHAAASGLPHGYATADDGAFVLCAGDQHHYGKRVERAL